MPVSERDYMRQREPRRYRTPVSFNLHPVLVIIILNLLVFIASLISSKVAANLGLIPALFAQRPWTIITNMFVHAGFGHLFGNMITLFFFGTFLSRLIGNGKFLMVYFGGGILGNILYLWLGDPYSIAVGASGAVYAVAGAMVVMMPNLPVRLYFLIPMPLWVFVVIFLVLLSSPFFAGPYIAWQAHLGGLLTGLVAGYFFRRQGRYYQYRTY